MRGRRLAALVCAALAACSSYTSMSGAPDAAPVAPVASDGGGDDAADDGADGGAEVDASPLIVNAGFEDPGAVGCGPGWFGFAASLTRVAGAGHSGTYACLVCQNVDMPGAPFGVLQTIAIEAGTYDLQAWARERVDGSAPEGGVVLSLVYETADGGRKSASASAALAPEYAVVQLAGIPVTPDAAPYIVKMTSRFPANLGDCFVVDDFLLVAE